jgi:O-antigen ligase
VNVVAAVLILVLAAATVATLRWPWVGVCSILVLEFLRPQDLYPLVGEVRPVLWVAIATSIATVWHNRTAWSRSWRPLLPLLSVLLIAALSAATSDLGGLAWNAWLALLKAALIASLIVVHVDSERRLEVALWCIAGSIGVLSLAAIARGIAIGYPDSWNLRLGGIGGPAGRFSAQWPGGDGPMRDNNAFARVLLFSLPIAWALCFRARVKGSRALAAIAGAATLVALMVTFSRSGFVAVAAVAAVAALEIRPLWKGAAALAGAVVLVYALTPSIYHDRIASTTLDDPSLRLRYGIWEQGLEMAASRPFLGVGIGTFTAHYAVTAPPPPRSSHNVFVEVLAEMGGLGLIAYLWLVGAAWWRLRRSTTSASARGSPGRGFPGAAQHPPGSASPGPLGALARGLSLGLVGYLVASTTLSHAFSPHLVSGLALAFASTWRRGTEREARRVSAALTPIEAME